MADSLGSNPNECWDNFISDKTHEPEACRDPHPALADIKCFYADHEWDKPTDVVLPVPPGTYAGLYKANGTAPGRRWRRRRLDGWWGRKLNHGWS